MSRPVAAIRRQRALSVACPADGCRAPAGEACRNLRSAHRHPIDKPHRVRYEAAGATTPPRPGRSYIPRDWR